RPLGRSGSEPGVYLLDTASRRRSLLAASVWLSALERSGCSPPWFLPTPSVIVCAVAHRADSVTRAYIAEFAIGTGQLVRRIPLPGVVRNGVRPQIVWDDPTGTQVIVLTSDPRPPVLGAVAAFLVTGTQVIRIPEARWPGMLSANLLGAW